MQFIQNQLIAVKSVFNYYKKFLVEFFLVLIPRLFYFFLESAM